MEVAERDVVHILLAGDEGVAPGLFVTTGSIVASSHSGCSLVFHVMDTGLRPDSIDRYRRFVAQFANVSVRIYGVDMSSFKGANPYRGNYATYARLLVGQYVKADRVVYFDTDFLCMKDVADLYHRDISDKVVFATKTPMYMSLADDCPFLSSEEAVKYPYFNAGVLLINLAEWRNREIEHKLMDALRSNVKLEKHDQTLLNWVLRDEWGLLESEWGLLLCHDTDRPDDTNFHFGGGGVKPWQYGCHYGAVPLWWTVYDMVVRPYYRFAHDDAIRRKSYQMLWGAHLLAKVPFLLKQIFDEEKAARILTRDGCWAKNRAACDELKRRLECNT